MNGKVERRKKEDNKERRLEESKIYRGRKAGEEENEECQEGMRGELEKKEKRGDEEKIQK